MERNTLRPQLAERAHCSAATERPQTRALPSFNPALANSVSVSRTL